MKQKEYLETDVYYKELKEKIFFSLKKEFNLIIENNPKTEKKVFVLCSILEWKEQFQQKENFYFVNKTKTNVVFYLTKTFKQIDEIICKLKEINKTLKSTIVGSKKQFCFDYPNCTLCIKNNKQNIPNSIMTVEEIKTFSKRKGLCPYSMTRSFLSEADVVFMPYGHVLNQRGRDSLGISLSGSIVIIDEAYELEDVCCENSSYIITTKTLESVLCLIKENNFYPKVNFVLQKILLRIIEQINNVQIKKGRRVFNGKWTLDLFLSTGICFENINTFLDVIDSFLIFLDNKNRTSLFRFRAFIQTIFLYEKNSYLKYKTVISDLKHGERSVFYLCNDSKVTVNVLKKLGFRTIITLNDYPEMFSFVKLGKSFLYNKKTETFKPELFIIRRNEYLKSTLVDREDIFYQKKTGEFVLNIAIRTDKLIVVFFQSYFLLNMLISSWKKIGIWDSIKNGKKILFNKENAFQKQTILFSSMIQQKCFAEIIIVIGVPFGSFNEYTKSVIVSKNKVNQYSGDVWYLKKAILTMIKTISFSMNKRNTKIFLYDKRYSEERTINFFPDWLKNNNHIIDEKNLFDFNWI